MRSLALTVVLLALVALAAKPALADENIGGGPPTVATSTGPALKGPSVWGILPWSGVGIGARMMFPVGIPSLLTKTSLRDAWGVEVGGDLLHWSYTYAFAVPGATNFSYSWTEVVPVAGLMWDVWLLQNFALYPKIELGYALGWFSGWNSTVGAAQPTYGGFFWDLTAGALYKMQSGLTLRAEVGYAGLKLGAGWLF